MVPKFQFLKRMVRRSGKERLPVSKKSIYLCLLLTLALQDKFPHPLPVGKRTLNKGVTGRKIKIHSLDPGKSPYGALLNLSEVTVYGDDGKSITGGVATLSSEWSDAYPAENCIDVDPSTFCHSGRKEIVILI